jgi:hypothetical protein
LCKKFETDKASLQLMLLSAPLLHWYDSGTIATCRPKPAEAFQPISVKLCSDDSPHMQSRRQSTLHSYASNRSNACKGNLTNLRRELHLSLTKGNPK